MKPPEQGPLFLGLVEVGITCPDFTLHPRISHPRFARIAAISAQMQTIAKGPPLDIGGGEAFNRLD